MRRGELYLVERATKNDTKKQRVYVVVSRQPLISLLKIGRLDQTR